VIQAPGVVLSSLTEHARVPVRACLRRGTARLPSTASMTQFRSRMTWKLCIPLVYDKSIIGSSRGWDDLRVPRKSGYYRYSCLRLDAAIHLVHSWYTYCRLRHSHERLTHRSEA
jgi:hypothetical protein